MKISHALMACAQSVLLAACAVTQPDRSPAPAPSTTPAPAVPPAPAVAAQRPGIGVVESVSVVSLPSSGSAAGGGTAAGPTMAYRLRMPDGTTQDVVHTGERYALGDRLELTGDGRLVRR